MCSNAYCLYVHACVCICERECVHACIHVCMCVWYIHIHMFCACTSVWKPEVTVRHLLQSLRHTFSRQDLSPKQLTDLAKLAVQHFPGIPMPWPPLALGLQEHATALRYLCGCWKAKPDHGSLTELPPYPSVLVFIAWKQYLQTDLKVKKCPCMTGILICFPLL